MYINHSDYFLLNVISMHEHTTSERHESTDSCGKLNTLCVVYDIWNEIIISLPLRTGLSGWPDQGQVNSSLPSASHFMGCAPSFLVHTLAALAKDKAESLWCS